MSDSDRGVLAQWSADVLALAHDTVALAVGVLDRDGHAHYLNAGMRRLIGADLAATSPASAFAAPTFDALWHMPDLDRASGAVYEGWLTFGHGQAIHRSVHGRVVRRDDWLLIRTYHTGMKEFPSLMLFNLKEDPHETRNLASKHPDIVNAGLRRLESFITENLIKSGQPDPIFQVIADGGPLHTRTAVEPMAKLLRKTGREKHADWLEKNGGAPREDSALLL